jgi:acetyl/propionyl-CoA carboxylase alpha subunit
MMAILPAQTPTNPVTNQQIAPAPAPATSLPDQSTNGSPLPAPATNGAVVPASTNAAQPPATVSKAASEMSAAMQKLQEEGKLTSNRSVSAAVRKVIRDNSIQHDIPAPMGAKVIAVHKHPGDMVRIGDKIVTLLVNGKEVPILAKQTGVMQTINVSKGGVIGNTRPSAAKAGSDNGIIVITLRPLQA